MKAKAPVTGLPSASREMAAAIAEMRRDLRSFIDGARLMAEVRRASYLALVAEGFTPEQALELAKNPLL